MPTASGVAAEKIYVIRVSVNGSTDVPALELVTFVCGAGEVPELQATRLQFGVEAENPLRAAPKPAEIPGSRPLSLELNRVESLRNPFLGSPIRKRRQIEPQYQRGTILKQTDLSYAHTGKRRHFTPVHGSDTLRVENHGRPRHGV